MIEQCVGCNYWIDSKCIKYIFPEKQHSRIGGCAFRTHGKIIKSEDRGFVDPLKASKKAAAGIR